MWDHSPVLGCRRHLFAKIQIFVVLRHHKRYTGQGWDTQCLGEWRCWAGLAESLQCQPWGRVTPLLLVPGQCCKMLYFSMVVLAPSSAGSELQVCSSALALILQGLQRCHKAAWCVTSWNVSQLEHCCRFPLYFFFHAHSSPWLKIRQTRSTVKIKMFLVPTFPNAFPLSPPNQCITLYNTA